MNRDLQDLACRIFKLSCTILFSYAAMSYVMFHFATRTALPVKNGKLHSLFSVRARCCNFRIVHPRASVLPT